MHHHNQILKQVLSAMCDSVPLHIPDVPDIPSLRETSTLLEAYVTHPPTNEHLHIPILLTGR